MPEMGGRHILRRKRRSVFWERRLFDDEGKCEEVHEECKAANVKTRAHTKRLREETAEQRSDDAACRERALHDAERKAKSLRRCIECHNGKIHWPKPRRKTLKYPDEDELLR